MFYPMGEEFKSDAQVTIEILERTLQEIEHVERRLSAHWILYLDNCGRENKNGYG
jgi:hypothetical protein